MKPPKHTLGAVEVLRVEAHQALNAEFFTILKVFMEGTVLKSFNAIPLF